MRKSAQSRCRQPTSLDCRQPKREGLNQGKGKRNNAANLPQTPPAKIPHKIEGQRTSTKYQLWPGALVRGTQKVIGFGSTATKFPKSYGIHSFVRAPTYYYVISLVLQKGAGTKILAEMLSFHFRSDQSFHINN